MKNLTITIIGNTPVLKEDGVKAPFNDWLSIAKRIKRIGPSSVSGIEYMPPVYRNICGVHPISTEHHLMFIPGAIS